MRSRAGFTLFEIMLSIAIGIVVIGIAVPSVARVFSEQRLKATFESFDEFVRKAQMRAVTERRPFALVWEKGGIAAAPLDPTEEDAAAEPAFYTMGEGEALIIERPAALEKEPPGEWTFFRSGTCEPAIISYEGEAGKWSVSYDGLTVRPTFLNEETK